MKFKVGDTAELRKAFTQDEVAQFARLSLDDNPVHLDEAYAASTVFGRRIVHGFLVTSLVSAVLGTRLPGPGSIYLSQELKFKKPVHAGDEITARIEVAEVNEAKSIYVLTTTCLRGDEIVVEGKAVIKHLPPKS